MPNVIGKVESHTPGLWTFYRKDTACVADMWMPVVTVKADSIAEARLNIMQVLLGMVMFGDD